MTRYFILPLFFLSPLAWAQESGPEKPLTLEASVGAGWATYDERVSVVPLTAEWEAPTGNLRVQAITDLHPVELYASLRWAGSSMETEQWREGRFLVQENDLTYTGLDLRLGLRLPVIQNEGFHVIPRIGGAVKIDVYERENFFLLQDEETLFFFDDEVTETVFTAGPTVGLRIWKSLGERFALQLDTEFFWPETSEADNDGFDITIDGDGGFIWSAELALFVDLVQPENQMGVSVGMLVQDLDGGIRIEGDNLYEWPDSTLEQVYVELFWVAKF